MADQDQDVQTDVDDAIMSGGKDLMYKDLTRKAAKFRGVEDERTVEDLLKERRRDNAHKRRISLRAAADRATSRQTSGR